MIYEIIRYYDKDKMLSFIISLGGDYKAEIEHLISVYEPLEYYETCNVLKKVEEELRELNYIL
jgi:hypothetical protein